MTQPVNHAGILEAAKDLNIGQILNTLNTDLAVILTALQAAEKFSFFLPASTKAELAQAITVIQSVQAVLAKV